tara:strand:+ start:292 stop:513 length:222 start_codon:yes stop_codon:yes gene_type:complete
MYLTLKQTSKITGYSYRSIKRHIASGKIPVRKLSDKSQPRIWAKDIHSIMIFGTPYMTLSQSQRYKIDKVVSG